MVVRQETNPPCLSTSMSAHTRSVGLNPHTPSAAHGISSFPTLAAHFVPLAFFFWQDKCLKEGKHYAAFFCHLVLCNNTVFVCVVFVLLFFFFWLVLDWNICLGPLGSILGSHSSSSQLDLTKWKGLALLAKCYLGNLHYMLSDTHLNTKTLPPLFPKVSCSATTTFSNSPMLS